MSIELDLTSTVVLGAWNPAIVNPQWLLRQEIVKTIPTDVEFGFQPLRRAIRFPLADMTWEVNDSRLAVICKSMKNCGTYAAKVLADLSHTPVQAIGTNFVFKGETRDWPKSIVQAGKLRVAEPYSATRISQVSWEEVADLDEDTALKLTTTTDMTNVVVSFNFHRNCDDAAKARKFARRWRKDREVVLDILARKFKVELS